MNERAVYMVRCPLHGRMVATDTNGHLLGKCSGCRIDADEAQRKIERGEVSAQLLLGETV